MYLLDLTIGKGRVAYFLKQSRPSKIKRKIRSDIKQTWIYLKKKRERRNKRSNHCVKNTCQVGRGLTTRMWTWDRSKFFGSSQYENDASPTDKILKIVRDILF